MADGNDMQDCAADCDGEGQEKAVRDGRDIIVVMMAVAVEDGGGGQRWQTWTTIAAEDNGMQDRVADYDRKGQERVAREGRDSGVGTMAAAADDNGRGGRQRRWLTTTAADD